MELGHSWNGRSPCSEVSFPVSPLYLEPGEYGHLGFTESTSPNWQGVLRVLPSSHIYSPLWPVISLWWMWWCLWRERNGCQTQSFPYDCVNAFINSPLWRKKKTGRNCIQGKFISSPPRLPAPTVSWDVRKRRFILNEGVWLPSKLGTRVSSAFVLQLWNQWRFWTGQLR